MNFVIRAKEPDDEDLIYSSWLKSFKSESIQGKRTYSHVFFGQQHDVIENLLRRGTTLIACWEKDPMVIAGYLNYEKKDDQLYLHYAFTKHKFRRMGVLRALLAAAGFKRGDRPYFSHWTESMDDLIRHYPEWIYNAYSAT